MSLAADLFALQELDLAIDTQRSALESCRGQLGETGGLEEARTTVEARRALLRPLQARQRELDARDKDLTAHIEVLERKLYSGTVTNPRELAGYNEELKMLKRHRSSLDDKLLAVMAEAEEAEAALAAAEEHWRRAEADWVRRQEELRAELQALEGEISRLEARRRQEAQALGRPAVLAQYEALRQRRGGRALARVERGICQGCRLTLPVHVVRGARGGNGLVPCPQCERILYVV